MQAPEPEVYAAEPEPISNQVAAEPIHEQAPEQPDQPMPEPEQESSFQVIEEVQAEPIAPAVV